MHKDEAVDIAHNADAMTLEQLIEAYGKFNKIVTNTPISIHETVIDNLSNHTHYPSHFVDGLHGAIGLVTEASEILDAYKKDMFGKRKPLRPDNIREECGDIFFYLTLVMRAYKINIRDIVKDNVVKLANRYIEKFEV